MKFERLKKINREINDLVISSNKNPHSQIFFDVLFEQFTQESERLQNEGISRKDLIQELEEDIRLYNKDKNSIVDKEKLEDLFKQFTIRNMKNSKMRTNKNKVVTN